MPKTPQQVNTAALYFLPVYFETTSAKVPFRIGLLLVPTAVAQTVGSWAASLYLWRLGRYAPPIWLGMLLSTIGYGLLAVISTESPEYMAILFSVIAGAGVGLADQPPLIALKASLEYMDMAQANVDFGLVRLMAKGISIVMGGVVFQNTIQSRLFRDQFSGQKALANAHAIWMLEDEASAILVVREAYTQSLGCMWILYSCISGLGLLCSFLIKRERLSTEQLQSILVDQQAPAAAAVQRNAG